MCMMSERVLQLIKIKQFFYQCAFRPARGRLGGRAAGSKADPEHGKEATAPHRGSTKRGQGGSHRGVPCPSVRAAQARPPRPGPGTHHITRAFASRTDLQPQGAGGAPPAGRTPCRGRARAPAVRRATHASRPPLSLSLSAWAVASGLWLRGKEHVVLAACRRNHQDAAAAAGHYDAAT